jgi:hypothetical protein
MSAIIMIMQRNINGATWSRLEAKLQLQLTKTKILYRHSICGGYICEFRSSSQAINMLAGDPELRYSSWTTWGFHLVSEDRGPELHILRTQLSPRASNVPKALLHLLLSGRLSLVSMGAM